MRKSVMARKEAIEGFLCISPWLFGFLVLVFGPMLFSLAMSFTDWDMINRAEFVGLANYHDIVFDDFRFRQSLKVTAIYAFTAVPLGLISSLSLALLLNMKLKGMHVARAIFYLPAILPPVAMAMVWQIVFKQHGGVANTLLGFFGVEPIAYFTSTQWALPTFVVMSLWGIGGSMIIFLAGLQSVPSQLYEAAEIDGAGTARKFSTITLPMVSPTILFNVIVGIIGSFQVFTTSLVITEGGPAYSTLFYVLYLYQKAFVFLQMGYACALAWILFAVVLGLTLLILKTSAGWVYYEAELKK